MELPTVATVSIWLVVGSLVVCGWRLLDWIWLRPKKLEKCLREQGFAGNPYRIFFGDLKEMAAIRQQANSKPMNFSHDIAPRAIPSLYQTIQKYGKNSFMWIGTYPRVNIMEPELFKSIFSMIYDIQKPNPNPLIKFLIYGLANHEGEKWAKHRKLLTPAFHLEKLKDMVPTFHLSCSEMIDKWERMISKEGSCELDVLPYLESMVADAISRTAFGSNYKEGKRIFELLIELTELVMEAISGVYIPGWRFLPTKSNNRIKKMDREIKTLLLGIINKRQKAMETGEATQSDLLGILLESNLREIREQGNKKDVGMSIEDVIEECKVFYIAGQETSGALLAWTMVLLASKPEWQERARAEVLEVFGNRKPDFDNLSRLKVVTMILNEAFRLYPPAGLFARLVQKDTRVGNLTLPAGVMLSFPAVLIHRDPEIWGEDVNEFRPERFSEGVSKATKGLNAFFPFGWGPRICIGQNFAMIEAKVALSTILQRFSFELSSSYTHAPTTVVIIKPQHGAHLVLHKL